MFPCLSRPFLIQYDALGHFHHEVNILIYCKTSKVTKFFARTYLKLSPSLALTTHAPSKDLEQFQTPTPKSPLSDVAAVVSVVVMDLPATWCTLMKKALALLYRTWIKQVDWLEPCLSCNLQVGTTITVSITHFHWQFLMCHDSWRCEEFPSTF